MDLYVPMCAHVYCVTCNVQCAPDRFCATRGCGELLGSRLTFLDNWNGFPNARRLSISQFTIFHLTFHWVFHNISHFNHNLTLCLLSHLSQWCTTISFADKAEDKWIDMKWHILQKKIPECLHFIKYWLNCKILKFSTQHYLCTEHVGAQTNWTCFLTKPVTAYTEDKLL